MTGAPHPHGRSPRHRFGVWAGALLTATSIAFATAGTSPASAQSTAPSDPLAAFGAKMVGSWEAEDSRHVFEWGVGERVLKSTSYAPEGNRWIVTSEGWWYLDPVTGTVRGTTIAVGMGIDLFEHSARVGAGEIVHDLVAHGPMGGSYVERWVFDADGYAWTLEQDGTRLMEGHYRRGR